MPGYEGSCLKRLPGALWGHTAHRDPPLPDRRTSREPAAQTTPPRPESLTCPRRSLTSSSDPLTKAAPAAAVAAAGVVGPWVVVDTGVVVDTMCMSAMQSARMLGESFLSRQNVNDSQIFR